MLTTRRSETGKLLLESFFSGKICTLRSLLKLPPALSVSAWIPKGQQTCSIEDTEPWNVCIIQEYIVRRNLAMHRSVTPFVIRQPIRRPRLLERVYKPMHTPH